MYWGCSIWNVGWTRAVFFCDLVVDVYNTSICCVRANRSKSRHVFIKLTVDIAIQILSDILPKYYIHYTSKKQLLDDAKQAEIEKGNMTHDCQNLFSIIWWASMINYSFVIMFFIVLCLHILTFFWLCWMQEWMLKSHMVSTAYVIKNHILHKVQFWIRSVLIFSLLIVMDIPFFLATQIAIMLA